MFPSFVRATFPLQTPLNDRSLDFVLCSHQNLDVASVMLLCLQHVVVAQWERKTFFSILFYSILVPQWGKFHCCSSNLSGDQTDNTADTDCVEKDENYKYHMIVYWYLNPNYGFPRDLVTGWWREKPPNSHRKSRGGRGRAWTLSSRTMSACCVLSPTDSPVVTRCW